MLVLAFDTSSNAVTVALVESARTILANESQVEANRQGELLAPMIDRTMQGAKRRIEDLDAIGVGIGPGPFTGLRVGIVTARAMADALGVPVYGECSLDLIARRHSHEDISFAVMSDARRKQVYWAMYDETAERIEGPELGRPDEVAAHLRARTTTLAGAGAQLYREQLSGFDVLADGEYPSAVELGFLALDKLELDAPSDALAPLYLRRPDATPPGERKRVTPA